MVFAIMTRLPADCSKPIDFLTSTSVGLFCSERSSTYLRFKPQ